MCSSIQLILNNPKAFVFLLADTFFSQDGIFLHPLVSHVFYRLSSHAFVLCCGLFFYKSFPVSGTSFDGVVRASLSSMFHRHVNFHE